MGGVVVVTTFKYDRDGQCAAKRAGVRIGDRIMVTGRSGISNIGALQGAMKEIIGLKKEGEGENSESKKEVDNDDEKVGERVKKEGEKIHVPMLLLRSLDPKMISGS
jgi:thiamine monophosphate kinase